MRRGQRAKAIGLVVTGVLIGAMLVAPASAHVGGTAGHVWTDHLLAMAKRTFFTKTQTDARYVRKGASVTAPNFAYTAPRTGTVFIQAATCQRAGNDMAPFENTLIHNWPSNSYSPGISTDLTTGTVTWYCPVDIPRPPGGAIRFTTGQMAYFDNLTTCIVGAEVVTKQFGTGGFTAGVHDERGEVFSGTNSSDRATAVPGDAPAVKDFTFAGDATARTLALGDIAWVNPFVGMEAANSCRFIGLRINYTVDRP